MRSLTGESDEINPMMQPFKKNSSIVSRTSANRMPNTATHAIITVQISRGFRSLSLIYPTIGISTTPNKLEADIMKDILRFRFADARQIHRQHRGKHAQAPVKEEIGQGIRRVTATKRSLAFFHLNPTAFPKFRAHATHNVQPFPSRLIHVHHTKSPVAFQAFCARKNFYFCKAVKRYPRAKRRSRIRCSPLKISTK